LCAWRAKTFSTKEPETLEWIDSIPKDSILWDVGANIGLYSVYAAKKCNCRVWAFEPSVFNLELLARNIFTNGLIDQVCIVPVALSDQLGASQMHMTTTEWGGALSTFGQNFGWDGKTIRQVFEFQTIGLSMEDAVRKLAIPQPDYIKMDVDGLEHFILKGGLSVLAGVKEILIEVNDDFQEQADQCRSLLTQAGLVLMEKRHSEMIATNLNGFQNAYNQIWVRS
jgi:FkbM family methyltransferase